MSDYVIKSGDTLSHIAKTLGTTVKELQKQNNIKDPNKIMAGAILKFNGAVNTDNYNSSEIPTQSDGIISDKTQIKNNNMKNLQTAYKDLMINIDSFELPKDVDKEKFKELVQSGYTYHIIENDFPETAASAADFVADLLINASNEFDSIDKETIIKFAADMYPEYTLGGIECSRLDKEDFSIVNGSQIILNDEIKSQNEANLQNAYNNLEANIDNLGLLTDIDKAKLPQILDSHLATLPKTYGSEAEFFFSLLNEATYGKDAVPSPNLVKIAASQYPEETIGGISCKDLVNNNFSIERQADGSQKIVLAE